MIISNLLLCDNANPALAIKSFVSSKLSSKAIAKARAVALDGLYPDCFLSLKKVFCQC